MADRAVSVIRVFVLACLIAACGSTTPPGSSVVSTVTEAEARAMTENMLAAYNSGDYEAWSRDWSSAMKGAIPEQAFRDFHQQSTAATGSFRSIESMASRPGDSPGVTRWESTVEFEKGRYVFMIAFNPGSKLIEGVNLAPAS